MDERGREGRVGDGRADSAVVGGCACVCVCVAALHMPGENATKTQSCLPPLFLPSFLLPPSPVGVWMSTLPPSSPSLPFPSPSLSWIFPAKMEGEREGRWNPTPQLNARLGEERSDGDGEGGVGGKRGVLIFAFPSSRPPPASPPTTVARQPTDGETHNGGCSTLPHSQLLQTRKSKKKKTKKGGNVPRPLP
jgi:hypothetical protein